MSLIPTNILKKCFRDYQNKNRFLLIVLIREEGRVTARYMQELINNDIEIDIKERGLIKVINFDEFLRFLNLDIKRDILNFKKWNSQSKELKGIVMMFQKTKKLSLEAIKSSCALKELKKLSEKYRKLLGIEFHSQEKEVDFNINFCNQPYNDYNKFYFNQKDKKYHCSRRDQKKDNQNEDI